MSFSDEHMDRAIRRMEKQLRTVYAAAWTDAQELLDGFMKTWAAREKKIVDDLENDRIQLPPNETKESYLRKWRLNHIGMSQRWAAIRQGIVDRMTDANRIAVEQINGITPSVMAANHNYTAYQIEKDIPNITIDNGPKMGVSFNLVNEHAVANLQSGTKTLLPKRKLDVPKDKMWNKRKIQNEILSGILTGKSVDKIAKDLQRITDMNAAASMRNARTALGAAQCAGQQLAMDEAADMGIEIMKEWRATLDDRTRDSHQNLDGVRVGKDETFPNGCFYPCDPNGPAKEVYNCRCVLKTIIPGVNDDRGTRIGRGEDGKWTRFDNTTYRGVDDTQSYAAWMQEKINGAETAEKAKEYADEANAEGIKLRTSYLNASEKHGSFTDSYTSRNIEITDELKVMDSKLKKYGDYIEARKGKFRIDDISVLARENRIEYGVFSANDISYLVRGDVGGVEIPDVVLSRIIQEKGTIDYHCHPYAEDLIPSVADRNLLKLLKWQDKSYIITTDGRISEYTRSGVTRTDVNRKEIDSTDISAMQEMYDKLFGGD